MHPTEHMKTLAWNSAYWLLALLLTAGFFYFIHFVYFSGWERAYGVLSTTFVVIIYSNVLSLAYRFFKVKAI
jgi:hypothetical protein